MKNKLLALAALTCAIVVAMSFSPTSLGPIIASATNPDASTDTSPSTDPGSGGTGNEADKGGGTTSPTPSVSPGDSTPTPDPTSTPTTKPTSTTAPSSDDSSDSTASTDDSSVTLSVGGSSGQVFSQATLDFFAKDLVVEGGVVTAVDVATAQDAITEAVKVYGNDTFVAGIVDIDVPGATFPYALTIKCSNVWAGQTVTILHKVNGVWERLSPSAVADNSVTVTVNSFSPFAIVIDTNPSPKTGDIVLVVSGLAGLFAAGTILTRKKRQ